MTHNLFTYFGHGELPYEKMVEIENYLRSRVSDLTLLSRILLIFLCITSLTAIILAIALIIQNKRKKKTKQTKRPGTHNNQTPKRS